MSGLTLHEQIRAAVSNAECGVVDRKRCFIISAEEYWTIVAELFEKGRDIEYDPRISAAGYDNFLIQLSTLEKNAYYLCAKTGAELDTLWETKGPKEKTT